MPSPIGQTMVVSPSRPVVTDRRSMMCRALLAVGTAAVLTGCDRLPGGRPEARDVAEEAAVRGKATVVRVGCGVCHVIPTVPGPRGTVGPSLAGVGNRGFVAGTLPNRLDVLAAFVRDAPALVPRTAMPPMPLDEEAARDVALFLSTLR